MPNGDWMETYSGIVFYPLDPQQADICIEDIAHSLALQCRYTGHCKTFYSVAQHSVLVSGHVSDEWKLAALLHDASEAYLCDVPRPIKPFLSNYKEIEKKVQLAVYRKFGISLTLQGRQSIEFADHSILADEQKYLMKNGCKDWDLPYQPLGIEIDPWIPELAEQYFMNRFKYLNK